MLLIFQKKDHLWYNPSFNVFTKALTKEEFVGLNIMSSLSFCSLIGLTQLQVLLGVVMGLHWP